MPSLPDDTRSQALRREVAVSLYAGMLARSPYDPKHGAEMAVKYADALLDELERTAR
jgi:hypothetical protein